MIRVALIAVVCTTMVACAHGRAANGQNQNCRVPKLVERSEDSARKVLVSANLRVGNVRHLMSGRVVSQQFPSAGSIVSCGSAVDFVVGV